MEELNNEVVETAFTNVITKEEFNDIVVKTFKTLGDVLAKSFGPYGSNTLIFKYPDAHSTKDGFTIMKAVSFNTAKTLKYQTVADLVSDICTRLNIRVGDGTTTSVIATNTLYESYLSYKQRLDSLNIMPREFLKTFDLVTNKILEELPKRAIPVVSSNRDDLANNIYKVVYISSNGDEEISNMIADVYKKIGTPAITVGKADDGNTKVKYIRGYNPSVYMGDTMYATDDDGTTHLSEADVLIFSIRVTTEIFQKIIVPLETQSAARGRKLLVLAPYYDELTLSRYIIPHSKEQFSVNHTTYSIFCGYRAVSENDRALINDFAMLCNTKVLDRPACRNLIDDAYDTATGRRKPDKDLAVNYDYRDDIPNLVVFAVDPKVNEVIQYAIKNGQEIPSDVNPIKAITREEAEKLGWNRFVQPYNPDDKEALVPFRMGYARDIDLTLSESKGSLFREFFYDEEMYKIHKRDAEASLATANDKYAALGTFNIEITRALRRLQNLSLSTAVIEAGGKSELSVDMNKDQLEDAVKAASSAYDNGIILGCNVTTIQIIDSIMSELQAESYNADDESTVELELLICDMLRDAFKGVYHQVLLNAFPDDPVVSYDKLGNELYYKYHIDIRDQLDTYPVTSDTNTKISIIDTIIEHSIDVGEVYDVSKKELSKDVVNSTLTDYEVLKATSDLIRLLISGNQAIITQKPSVF